MRYSGHHFSRLTRAGSLHSHPERPAYLMRESWKGSSEQNGVSLVVRGAEYVSNSCVVGLERVEALSNP